MLVMVPTSLFTAITDTTGFTPSACKRVSVSMRASRLTAPCGSASTTTPPTCSTQCKTAWCSLAEHTAWVDTCCDCNRRMAPNMAALAPSVPPPVKIISPAWQPKTSATSSRHSSSTLRASRAKRCEPDGLAYCTLRNGPMAAMASARIGVVAA